MTTAVAAIVQSWLNEIENIVSHASEARTGRALLEAELAIFSCVLRLADALMSLVLATIVEVATFVRAAVHAVRQEDEQRSGAEPPLRQVRMEAVEVRLLGGGTTRVRTPYFAPDRRRQGGRRRGVGKRGAAGVGRYPVLEALGITADATPALQAEIARQLAECSSHQVAVENLAARGIKLNVKVAARLGNEFARRALSAREAIDDGRLALAEEESKALAGKRVVVSLDGGRYRERIPVRRGRRRASGHRGFQAPWKEPKAFIVYVIDENGERDDTIKPFCDATTGDADAIVLLLEGCLRAHGASSAKELIFVADGAHWIWERIAGLVDRLGAQDAIVTEVLDFFHAVEHAAELANSCLGAGTTRARSWLTKQRRRLKRGEQAAFLSAIDELPATSGTHELRTRERSYFKRNADRMQYARFKEQGVPRGSGAIESVIRRVINLRVKSNGKFWLRQNAENILHLRANLKCGRWQELIEHVLQLTEITHVG